MVDLCLVRISKAVRAQYRDWDLVELYIFALSLTYRDEGDVYEDPGMTDVHRIVTFIT